MGESIGFAPVSSLKMQLDFCMMSLSYVSAANQVRIFLLQPLSMMRVAAMLLSLCILSCLRDQLRIIPSQFQFTTAWNSSLKKGFMDPRLRQWLSHSVCSKQSMAMLFVPYCTLKIAGLTNIQCCQQVASFFLAVKSLVGEDVGNHLGDELRQFGEAIVKRERCGWIKITALRAWCFACHAGNLALHALVMERVHPLVSFALLIPAGFVKYIHMGSVELPQGQLSMWWWLQASWMEPHSLFVFRYCSLFGIPLFQVSSGLGFINFGNKPIWPMFWSQVFRIVCSIGLLLPWLTSADQNGFQDLMAVKLNSSAVNSSAVQVGLENVTAAQFFWEVSSGEQMYSFFLLSLTILCVPLYLASLIVMACVMTEWRSGEEDIDQQLLMMEMVECFCIDQD
jgi:hypothetical protein